MRGKTIQIYLTDGSPNGIKVAEITSNIERTIVIPRNKLTEAVKRTETARPGIYFLFGHDEDKAKPVVYIGQTKEGIKRIKTHDQKIDFWHYGTIFKRIVHRQGIKLLKIQEELFMVQI